MKLTLIAAILAATINIIPQPQSIREDKGEFKLKGTSISCDSRLSNNVIEAVKSLSTQLTLAAGQIYPVTKPAGLAENVRKGNVKGITLAIDPTLAFEAYTINVTPKSVLIKAAGDEGFFNALQTFKQLLPVEIFGKKAAEDIKWVIPCCEIRDVPRFHYRGMHLDCGRHFFSVEEIKKVLDVMATLKLNRFHWHLTEDQGWRAEIKKYPELTNVGAWRSGTMVGYYDGPSDNIRYGGYYTQEQMRDVVAYAEKLGITIVPEVDLPGHMVAALASYPYLGCTGGPYEVWYHWGIHPDVLCLGKESTYEFLEDVLGELCDIFPGEYFHIGGDEAPDTRWKECPHCQAKVAELGLKADDHCSAERRLQNYVTKRMQDFLATRGKKLIGWDEILEGELAEGATVMSWRGTSGGIKASNAGFDVVMTPTTYCYFDYCQFQADSAEERIASGEPLCAYWGSLTLEKVYSFNPTEGLAPEAAKHILGAQANVWTEYIPTDEQLEYQMLPRLFALSEVQWCMPEDKLPYEQFHEKVMKAGFPMLDAAGYNYRPEK